MRPSVLSPALLLVLVPLSAFGQAPCGEWEQVHPWPTGDWVTGIAYGNGRYVGMGGVLESEDGVVWTRHPGPEPGGLADVVWTGERFLAVGGALWGAGETCRGVVSTSTDGLTWDSAFLDVWLCLSSLRWNGELFVSLGQEGWPGGWNLISSPDGVVWTAGDASSLNPIRFAWGNGTWIAVGEDILTSRDAVSWELVQADVWLNDVVWDGTRFVAVGWYGVMTSADGESWETVAGPGWSPDFLSTRIAWNGEALLVTASRDPNGWTGPGEVATSADGVYWSAPRPLPSRVFDSVWAEGQWLVVGSDGLIGTSGNGLDWRWQYRPRLPGGVNAVASNGSLSVAVGDLYRPHPPERVGRISLSSDSVTWRVVEEACCGLWDVDWDGSRWLVVGSAGTVLESPDGEEWRPLIAPDPVPTYTAVASSGDVVVLAAWWPEPLLATVVGGAAVEIPLPPLTEPLDVIWTGTRFVVVGGELIGHSIDGLEWQFELTERRLQKLASNGQRVVAVGSGVGLWSDDGVTWNDAEIGTYCSEVIWAGDRFVAASDYGSLAESIDGVTWTRPEDAPVDRLSGLAWTGREVLALSTYGGLSRRRCGEENLPLAALQSVVPVVAHRSGVGGSFWRSDLQVVSNTDEWTEVWVSLGFSSTTEPEWRRFFLPPGGQLDRDDVVERTFGEVDAVGPLLIAAERPVAVTSRTFTEGMLGTYGQEVPALPLSDLAVGVTPLVLPLLEQDAGFRTNLGLVNAGAVPIALAVELVAADGRVLGSLSQELGPFGLVQLDAVLADLGVAPVADAYAVVGSSDPAARFAAYASVVDNQSQDAAMVIGAPSSSEPLVIPAAAHSPGSGDTFWRTDLEVVNADGVPAAYDLELLAGDQPISVSFELSPGQARRHQDVVDGVFGSSGTYAIVVTPTEGAVAVASRTFTTGAAGSFGQAVPAVRASSGIGEGETAVLPGLAESGYASGTRTNLGLVNLGEEAVTATVEVFRGNGQRLKTLSVPVPARSLAVTTRVFARCGGREVESGYIAVRCSSPGGRILAWASVVDNLSGDPVFIPAQVVGE